MNEEKCAVREPRQCAADMVEEQGKMLAELVCCLNALTVALDGEEKPEGSCPADVPSGVLDRIYRNCQEIQRCVNKTRALIGMISG